MRKRRGFTPEYKAKIVLEILKEEKTISEIASREEIHMNQISAWKRDFLENASRAFSQSRSEKEAEQKVAALEDERREYQAKVGQLTLEVDWLKKKHEQVYGSEWETKLGFKK